jgi:hypothetical protein
MALVNSKLVSSTSVAKECEKELRELGYQQVYITGAKSGETISDDDAMRSMMNAYVVKSDAQTYLEAIRKGAALITVHSSFGTSKRALKVIDKYQPLASAADPKPDQAREWDERTPASSALQWAALTKTHLPFETMWNVRSLTKSAKCYSEKLGMKPLSNKTCVTGAKLSSNPTPLSSKIGMASLSSKQGPKLTK